MSTKIQCRYTVLMNDFSVVLTPISHPTTARYGVQSTEYQCFASGARHAVHILVQNGYRSLGIGVTIH